jgi:multimeric flavodoxin WrbA
MKICVINGSPRKGCNTAQLLEAVTEGIRAENADAEIRDIFLYDHSFSGCKSCFACQTTAGRAHLGCKLRDDIHDLLEEARDADGIVVGAPIYFMDLSAQTKCFLERLNYPGVSPKKIPSVFLYTMNATKEQFDAYHFEHALGTTHFYMESNFGCKPDVVCSFDTYQFNDNKNLCESFRSGSQRKMERRKQQFHTDQESAREAGRVLVRKIGQVQSQP